MLVAVSAIAVATAADEVPSGPENLFPNPSFEEWNGSSAWPEAHGGRWSLETEKDEFGRPIFAHVGPTNGPARIGNIALHAKDSHGGAYNNVVRYTLPREAVKPFAGKGLKLSVWAHLLSKSAAALVGIGIRAECRESSAVSADLERLGQGDDCEAWHRPSRLCVSSRKALVRGRRHQRRADERRSGANRRGVGGIREGPRQNEGARREVPRDVEGTGRHVHDG